MLNRISKDGTKVSTSITADVTTSKPNYSQTHCYTALELLQQMLNEEHKAYQSNIENYMVSSGHDYNIETISQVIELIKELQANAV